MLSEHHLDSQLRWSKVKEKFESDSRYKAVDSSGLREDFFKQYMEKLAKVSLCVLKLLLRDLVSSSFR